MQSRSFCGILALLAAISFGLTSTAGAAERDASEIIAGRQKIRMELANAVADGNLSRAEQYRILLDAKEVLPDEDMAGLQRTLNRLASKQSQVGELAGREDGAVSVAGYQEIEGASDAVSPFVEETSDGDVESEDEFVPWNEAFPDGLFAFDGKTFFAAMQSLGECSIGNIELSTAVDAFKGPMDVVLPFSERNGDNKGNFGVRFGIDGVVPVASDFGVAAEVGTNEIISDFEGGFFSGSRARSQNFTSVGLFQRYPTAEGTIGWGFTHDWLFDHYYSSFTFGQWRIKAAWEISCCNEIGMWTAIRDKGDEGFAGDPEVGFLEVHFRPLTQGRFYWKHTWCNDATLTGEIGLAEAPGTVVLAAHSRIPISPRLAVSGDVTYVPPKDRGGPIGQAEEFWNVTFGLEFVPGGFQKCNQAGQFAPFLGAPDNGTFMIRDVQ